MAKTRTPDSGSLADIAAAAAAPRPAPDMTAGQDGDEGGAYDEDVLGPKCPVRPLGFLKQKYYFLDFAGQLIELGSEFRKGEVMALFGTRYSWLEAKWPTKKHVGKDKDTGKDKWIVTGFDQKEAQKALIMAASRKRLFDPSGKVRGRGSHRGRQGELILHCGDRLLIGGRRTARGAPAKPEWAKAGEYADLIFPTAPSLPSPADKGASAESGRFLLDFLNGWNWDARSVVPVNDRPVAIEALIMLGWVALAKMCGATSHRPHVWLTGPSGAGKTTLMQVISQVMAQWALESDDPSEAWIRQKLMDQRLPVLFDEPEPDQQNQHFHKKIITLARLAFSGGKSGRGGADHKAVDFVAYSTFLFASINHHELEPQDRNRMAILKLAKMPADAEKLVMPGKLEELGLALTRRLVDQWSRFDLTLLHYQVEMQRQGYAPREQDTYGTFLACADLLLNDHMPDVGVIDEDAARAHGQVRALLPLLDIARAEAEDQTERCIKRLTSTRLPARGGEAQEAVGRWITKRIIEMVDGKERDAAKKKLRTHGMKLVHLDPGHASGNGQGGLIEAYMTEKVIYVAIANKTHQGMAEIFHGSVWQGGQWNQALVHVEGRVLNKKTRFDGGPDGCTLVPLSALIGDTGLADAVMEAKQMIAAAI